VTFGFVDQDADRTNPLLNRPIVRGANALRCALRCSPNADVGCRRRSARVGVSPRERGAARITGTDNAQG
jgi:hypothetical protein